MISPLTIACTDKNIPYHIIGKMANRHGLIAGATGTGKTVTLRKMAEMFSNSGVPVFLVDVKGDLSGIAKAGDGSGKIGERIQQFNFGDGYLHGFPTRFWDVYGKTGIPIRVSIESMGVLLLARLMNLTEAQEGVLNLVFRVAKDLNWRLIDLQDLRSMLHYVSENRHKYRTIYGNVTPNLIGVIQRQLLVLEEQGADCFFGLPKLDLHDWLRTSKERGVINILNAEKLHRHPHLYSAFMLWFLSELFEILPEIDDGAQPKLMMFFDEAHLMFNNPTPALLSKVSQTVRLIRSKGVGVYFVSQRPSDIPEDILGQLGNRVQHALRAYTPKDRKAVRDAAETFRPNPHVDTVQAISELAVGEALVSFLEIDGTPSMVQRAWIMPPQSRLKPLNEDERWQMAQNDPFFIRYQEREKIFSAYDEIERLAEQETEEDESESFVAEDEFEPLSISVPIAVSVQIQSTPTILQKGQNITLPDTVSRFIAKLNWQSDAALDIDVSVFLLNTQRKVRSDADFVFYNQPTSADHAIAYQPKIGNDAACVAINTQLLSNDIQSIVLAASIYQQDKQAFNFQHVKQPTIALFNDDTQQEILRFTLPNHDYRNETAMIFGEFYRRNEQWKFKAIGQGYSNGLTALCQQFGVVVK